MTLYNLDLVINELDNKKKDKFKVFFVSIDPIRDTPKTIKNYFISEASGLNGDIPKLLKGCKL